ncbi:MAG TPA: DUF4349 domain-containing protein [Candidatus Dormibacteraeota bacterium]|nr:DUF4349 domain-containing protein [Candidatus Dormibacteraeota bacterium]
MKKLLVLIALVAIAAACGGAAESNTSQSVSRNPTAANGGGTTVGHQPAPKDGSSTTTTTGGGTTTVPVLQGPPVIRQAQIAISVDNGSFDAKLAAVRKLVEGHHGYIAGTDAQANPVSDQPAQIRTGVINFMVPAAEFDEAIDDLSGVGKVQSEHISGTDVSAQYVDLRARLANAEAQRNAMLALLSQAKSINDIIAVQNQIGQITAQIEQLKGQIQYLDQNTSYSSVSVTLTEAGAPAKTQPSDSWGFATAVNDAAHNFVATINYVVTALGAVGPLLVLVLLGYLAWRARRREAPTAPRHA